MAAVGRSSAGGGGLVDRIRERAAIDALLAAARLGMSGALVVRGEAGMGKTALLDHAIASASDFRLLKATGIESEMNVGFAGLHQLVVPFLPQLDRLPPPQRNALGVAFGLSAGPTPERFQVGIATLTLLASVAQEKPLLGVIDDAQWLDVESAEVLGFVSRRLHAESITLLFGVREPSERAIGFAGTPELRLGPLELDDAKQLLGTVKLSGLDESSLERLLRETGGNPLAILEMTGETGHKWLADPAISEPMPVGERLQQHFLRQVEGLSGQAQAFVRLASAEPTLDPVVLWRAAKQLGLGPEAFAEAEAQHLILAGPPLAFRHPLIRSSTYYGMPPVERRRMHAALADATDGRFEPDRRAWHRALATIVPDEAIAAELAECGRRAQQRGAYAAWAEFTSRSADMTPDAEARAARLLVACQAWLAAGQAERAQALLREASSLIRDPLQRAQALAIDGGIHAALDQGKDAPMMLLEAARVMANLDPMLARKTLGNALSAALFSRPAMSEPAMQAIAAEALASTPGQAAADSADELLLRGYATVIRFGYASGAPILKRGIAATLQEGPDPQALQNSAVLAAYSLFDDNAVHELATDWVRIARERAALTALPIALILLASIEIYFGRLDEGEALFRQSLEISEASGTSGLFGWSSRGDVLLLAWRGNEALARESAAKHVAEAQSRGETFWANFAGFALTALHLASGRYHAALEDALPTYKDDPPYAGSWVLPNLIEAASRIGAEEVGRAALQRLAERAEAGGTTLGLGLLARCRALYAVDMDAEPLYREAIDRIERSPTRPELARTRLVFGEWLRRQNRRKDAREQLRAAYEMFSAMGINAFAERARIELLATGERVRRRTVEVEDQLSAQELQVARLAARGVRNHDIASQLFISERTVEYHLAKVFRKLDLSSRTQLAHAPQVVGAAPGS